MTETSIPAEQTDTSLQTAPACGAVLKTARELQKLTVEDISSRLRLGVRQIQALENDDFSLLPSASTMTRGFIRNYARLLGIDSEPLLQAYQSQTAGQINHALTIKSANILISSTQKPMWKKYIVSSLVILLLIGVWVIYMDYFHEVVQHAASLPVTRTVDIGQAQSVNTTNEPMPEPALPVAERDAAAEAIAPTPAEANPADKPLADKVLPDTSLPASTSTAVAEKSIEQSAVNANNPVAKPVTQLPVVPTPVTNNVAAAPATSQSLAVSSANTSAKSSLKIRFIFSESTWVSVLDADNKEVLNKTGQPGSQEKIEVTPPAKLVIGNANGTQLEVNNKTIDLTPYNKLNVVRLTLE